MPIQKTFTVIPYGAADPATRAQAARPMTSKQVRKAYKASNKAPPMSRAERIKEERAEQERIRKELEKEKSAAKAKAAREKKRIKEMAEMEEKKRKRLPLVNVRPSQDTIARFVRGGGTGKKRDAEGEPLKLEKVGEEPEPDMDETEDSVEVAAEDAQHSGSNDKGELDLIPEEDEFELEVLEELDTIMTEKQNEHDAKHEHDAEREHGTNHNCNANQEDNAEPEENDSRHQEDSQQNTQKKRRKPSRIEEDLGLHTSSPREETKPVQRCMVTEPPAPCFQSSSPCPPRQAPPMSTQAILCNFDDFFPTASQQALELEEYDQCETFECAKPRSESQSEPEPQPEAEPAQETETETEPPRKQHVDLKQPYPIPPPPPPPPSDTVTRESSNMPPPKRFFTSSGSSELLSMALLRSRRTAALEELHEKERVRSQVGDIARQEIESNEPPKRTLNFTTKPPLSTIKEQQHQQQFAIKDATRTKKVQDTSLAMKSTNANSNKLPPPKQDAKPATLENEDFFAELNDLSWPGASQETDYGGGWLDELASEVMI